MKAFILAAGLGTRLSPYTNILAKPAIPFLNIPLFYYSLALLKAAKSFALEECIINSHYKPEQILKLAKEYTSVKTTLSFEKEKPLGSGGGLWFARQYLQSEENFFILNGDEVILPNRLSLLDDMLEQHKSSGAMATLLVKRDPRVGSQFGGVWANPLKEVFGFGKVSPSKLSSPACLESSLEGLHYVGVMLMNKRAFQYFPEGESNILYDAVMTAHLKGEKIEVFIDDCDWHETGNIKDYLKSTHEVLRAYSQNSNDAFLQFLFCDFAKDSKLKLDANNSNLVFADSSAMISKKAKLNGFVVLGAKVEVPDHCELNNVVVNSNVNLKAKTYRDDLIL